MDTQENPRGEQGEHGEAAKPNETGNDGEDESNTYKNDDEADLGEPIPSSITIAELENPSSSTSIDAAGAPLENRDEAMGDFAEVGIPSSSNSINAAGAPAENRDEAMEDFAEVENPCSSTSIDNAGAAAENCDEVMENFATEEPENQKSSKELPIASEDPSSDSISEEVQNTEISEAADKSPDTVKLTDDEDEEDEEDEPLPKKQKNLSLLTPGTAGSSQLAEMDQCGDETEQSEPKSANGNGSNTNGKKSKKKSKNNNVWAKPASRKGKKKAKNNGTTTATPKAEDTVLIAPAPRCPDKNDDSPDMKICLSKFYKAEKVELSEDRLGAGSCKGYRMVRATRGVSEGAWYFEIKVLDLGETGHTRLGWSTEKGDLQAPVGYDANSYGYRDTDGSKIHKALREMYGEEGYTEGDVIGFYINLPEGNLYAPKQPNLVMYKGQRYVCPADAKLDPPKVVPGSEISFFKNGVCQGVAFRDLYGGRYYPAASMYTLPNQSICLVRFNFGPNFERFPEDFEGRPVPSPMIEIPYQGVDNRSENGESSEKNQ